MADADESRIYEVFDFLTKDFNSKNNMINSRYWIYAPGKGARFWEQYRNEGLMGVGWKKLREDLSKYSTDDELRTAYLAAYGNSSSEVDYRQLRDFVRGVRIGDKIFVKRGKSELIGFGVVTSDYFYDDDQPEYRHLRKAEWKKFGKWILPKETKRLPVKTLTLVDDQRRIKELSRIIKGPNPPYSLEECQKETGFTFEFLQRAAKAIMRKKQAVLYGPPGTGKTFLSLRLANHLIGGGDGITDLIQFHPSYAYEDFIQGIRPTELRVAYPVRDGSGTVQGVLRRSAHARGDLSPDHR
jgi:5-methylcytosine-specific restriction enzyme B